MISWNIEVFDSLGSTQDIAIARAEEGAAEGVVIQSMIQTGGRGRHGNQWISPLGNLYMSFLLRPMCTPDLAGQISFVIALALSAAMDPYTAGHKKTLKWPNDVLIDGVKCAGILLETGLSEAGVVEKLIVGMGVNIHAAPPERIGLQQVAGEKRLAVHRFRDELLVQIADYYESWKTTGFEPVRRDWLKQAHGLNHKISARLPDRTEKGIFRDLGPDGGLKMELEKGNLITIRAGEVFF
ncbi:MAG: Biotin-(acetyl-CoA carboxylase) ligase [Micavibrio sp.]|nr:Biotin-(acetyl-CoA carboxylase) ligase [Micavibrio sp.]